MPALPTNTIGVKTMEKPYLAAIAALDESPRVEVPEFVSPLGDQTAEVDREAETAAFVSRPEPTRELEPARPTETKHYQGAGNGRSPFAEAAGLYLGGAPGWLWPGRHCQSRRIGEVRHDSKTAYRSRARRAPG